MIWLVLWFIATLFGELNNSITKEKTKNYHYMKVGVVTMTISIIIYAIVALYKYYSWTMTLNFAVASIPLLAVRLVLEIAQTKITLLALKKCDRSTFSILRILTIPLLVFVDIILGYNFTQNSLIWIWIILFAFFIFNTNTKTFDWKWWYYALFTAVNAVATISLFKYSISHYWNSVEIDQWIMRVWVLIFFLISNYKRDKLSGYEILKEEKIFYVQAIVISISGLMLSYVYVYLNASEATAVKRVWEMFWAIIAGAMFFNEKQVIKKLCFATCIMIWMIIMVL